jgi:hypothetical protein
MVSQVFRRMQGIEAHAMPSRRQAEDWSMSHSLGLHLPTYLFVVASQSIIAQRIKGSIQTITSVPDHAFLRRPWQLVWLVNQIATCLSLYHQDPTLILALELAKTFLAPCDVLNALWPCPGMLSPCAPMPMSFSSMLVGQQHQCDELRGSLEQACAATRITGPLPPEFSVPPQLRQGYRARETVI